MWTVNSKRIAFGTMGILAIVSTLMILPPGIVHGADMGGPTITINPAQLPLPVSGTLDVKVGNLLSVVPAADLNPYQELKTFNWISAPCNFGGVACEFSFSAVPAGKRLVVDHISGSIAVNANVAVRRVRLSGPGSAVIVPTDLQSTFVNASVYAINSEVLIYFEAGESPRFFVQTDAVNLGFNNEVSISGHFVQVQ